MLKRIKMIKRMAAVLTAFVLVCISAVCYGAIDAGKKASLEIDYKYEGSPLSGAEFSIYKVANVSGEIQYTVTDQFRDYSVSFDEIKNDGGRGLAGTLTGYISRDNIAPLKKALTDTQGKALFGDIGTGLYVAVGSSVSTGGYTYKAEPFLVCLPNRDEGGWNYNVKAVPKLSRDKNPSGGGGYNPPSQKTREIGVLKIWEKDNEESRPKSIEVQLIRNKIVYDDVTLNKENNWHYTWKDLPVTGDYSVTEKSVPSGYTVNIRQEDNAYIIINTGNEEPQQPTTEAEKTEETTNAPSTPPTPNEPSGGTPPIVHDVVIPENTEATTEDPLTALYGSGGRTGQATIRNRDDDGTDGESGRNGIAGREDADGTGENVLPRTGQLWYPVPIMAVSGMILFLLGYIRRKEGERSE